MTSQSVAIGQNQFWSFTPAVDLLDERDVGPLRTPSLVTPTPAAAEASAASAFSTSASAGDRKSAADSLADRLKKFGLSTSARPAPHSAAAAAFASSSASADATAANPHATGSRNLLLVETGDILHALKTIIRQHRHVKQGDRPPPTHLYILDGAATSTARHMLLLAIAFDTSLSLRGRTELFLEVYGNAQNQEKTQLYINRKVKQIKNWLASLRTLSSSPSCESSALSASLFRGVVDVSHLKSRELDALDDALDFMTTPHMRPTMKRADETKESNSGESAASSSGASSSVTASGEQPKAASDALERVLPQKDPNAFDIETLRDHRLRGYFGDRYDSRANLVDWDYHMRLKAMASIIHIVHYKKWRLTGLAFEERLCTYNYANRSLASYRDAKSKSRGCSVSVRGYWSDTFVSPYISLGVEADDERLFVRRNRQHVKTAHHVSEYNLLSLLYELETGAAYHLPGKDEADAERAKKKQQQQQKPAGPPGADDEEIVQMPEEVGLPAIEQAATFSASASTDPTAPASLCYTTPSALNFAHVKLCFLHGQVKQLATRSRYHGLFDRVFVSQFEVGCINEEKVAALAAEAKKANAAAAAATGGAASAQPAAEDENDSAAATASGASSDPLPLNRMLKPNASITVETIKFLPVAVDLKDAYVARVEQLASSAGWQAASPARVAWSPDAAHSWTDERDFEAHTDEEDKRQALTQPVRLNFIAPAIASADKRAK